MKGLDLRLFSASGSPTTVGEIRLTPESQVLTVRFPVGGFVWNRPTAVVVERGGQVQRIPIVDATRLLQIGLLGLAFVVAIGWAARSTWQKERERDRNVETTHPRTR